MTINPIQVNQNTKSQPSVKQKRVVTPYLEAKGAIDTTKNVKPLKPQGHLVKDDLVSGTKYFFKDIAYDMKALKNGINGTANDHQLGRLNDVGLRLGGIGIATYLASRTTNPKAKIMEFVGLGAFLASMDLYPKLAINLPAKLRFGFDVNKQYIDDQGRKKSVMQDRNYIPYDMYNGDSKDEDLQAIGDKFGLDKDVINRNEVTKELMSKTATQYNTLWMMTAGFATPVLTSLICYGLENKVITPAIEKYRNNKVDKEIQTLLEATKKLSLDPKDLKANELSKNVEKILKQYNGQVIPVEEIDLIVDAMTADFDTILKESIAKDIKNLLRTSNDKNILKFSPENIDKLVTAAKSSIPGEHYDIMEKYMVLTKEELNGIVSKVASETGSANTTEITAENINKIQNELKSVIKAKINNADNDLKEYLNDYVDNVVDEMLKKIENVRTKGAFAVTEENSGKLIEYAKVMGDFLTYNTKIAKCQHMKFEYAPETILARYYNKFQEKVIKALEITPDEMKKLRESKEYTERFLDKKLEELCSGDKVKYETILRDLASIVKDMEKALHGDLTSKKSHIGDLITATENIYNNTAKRLANLGIDHFKDTINSLVAEDVNELSNSIKTKEDLFNFLNGKTKRKYPYYNFSNACEADKIKYINEWAKGVGSSKRLTISRLFDRYQGAVNSFYRMLHTFEVYNRATNPEAFSEILAHHDEKYVAEVIKQTKSALLTADSAAHTLKLYTTNSPNFYNDVIKSGWRSYNPSLGMEDKGFVTEQFKKALAYCDPVKEGYQSYIVRFKNLIGNLTTDFQKPAHVHDNFITRHYNSMSQSNSALFNLIGQTPVDMITKTSKSLYGTKKWFKSVSSVAGAILGVTLLAQLGFGRLSNPQNLKKQVNNDTSN